MTSYPPDAVVRVLDDPGSVVRRAAGALGTPEPRARWQARALCAAGLLAPPAPSRPAPPPPPFVPGGGPPAGSGADAYLDVLQAQTSDPELLAAADRARASAPRIGAGTAARPAPWLRTKKRSGRYAPPEHAGLPLRSLASYRKDARGPAAPARAAARLLAAARRLAARP